MLPSLEGRFDAVVTDPPYGVKNRGDYVRFSGGWTKNGDHRPIRGDDRPFDPTPFLRFPRLVLWGANFYSHRLPGGGWLVWCKKRQSAIGKFLGDCELAYFKPGKAVYLFHHEWSGLLRESERGVKTLHPSQKPVELMRWCIRRLKLKPGSTILDPYMGTGSCGLAAIAEGMGYIGVEIDPAYFKIAKARIGAAQSWPASTASTSATRSARPTTRSATSSISGSATSPAGAR